MKLKFHKILFYFCSSLIFLLVGCDNNNDTASNASQTAPSQNPDPIPTPSKSYYKVLTNVYPPNSGELKIEPMQEEYEKGTKVKITASSYSDYIFLNWAGFIESNEQSIEITVEGDISLIANFKQKEEWIINTQKTPDDIGKFFINSPPPQVDGVTSHANELIQTQINEYHEYNVNDDFKVTMGKLNHTKNEKILSMEFKTGNGLTLMPLERSTGQFSTETTTKTMDYYLSKGSNILASINADPFNIYNGWAVGITTIDGVNYTGTNISYNTPTSNESAVVVKNDGSAQIISKEDMPLFVLKAYKNGEFFSDVRTGYYFDKENNTNKFKFFANPGGGNLAVYSADNFSGPVNLSGTKSAVLVKPEINNVTVINDTNGEIKTQFPPFNSKVIQKLTPADSPIEIPSGHALIVSDTPAPLDVIEIGDELDLKLETDNPIWKDVKYALGGGFTTGLLVKDGALANDNNEVSISSRTALGIKEDGSIFFLTIDKPKGSPSDGVTLKKLGQIMLAYGAVDAIQLDGGGSTTMAYRLPTLTSSSNYSLNNPPKALLLNTPSDGNERAVATKWAINLESGSSYTNSIHLFPRELNILAGHEFRNFILIGYDGEFNSLSGDTSLAISDEKLGFVHISDLAFKATNSKNEGYIFAKIGDDMTASKLFIHDSIDEIKFTADNFILEPNEKIVLLPTLLKNGKSIEFSPSQLTYELENDSAGSIDINTGEFTAESFIGGKTSLTVSYGDVKSIITLQVGKPPFIFADFESDNSIFKDGGSRTKSRMLNFSEEFKYLGDNGLKLSWVGDETQAGTLAVEIIANPKEIEIKDYPKKIGFYIYIPEELVGKKVWLRAQYRDAENKAIAINYTEDTEIKKSGWQFVSADFPQNYKAPIYADKLFRFLVTKNDDRTGTDSYIYLDNFMALYSDNADFNGPEVSVSPSETETINIDNPEIKIISNDPSGVNPNSAIVKLDGNIVEPNFDANTSTLSIATKELSDGYHQVEYEISDKLGNVTSGLQLFNVITGKPRIFLDTSSIEFYAGSKAIIPIKVLGGSHFNNFSIKIDSNNEYHTKDLIPIDLSLKEKVISQDELTGTFENFNDSTEIIANIEIDISDSIENGNIKLFISGEYDKKPFYSPVIDKQIQSAYEFSNTYLTQLGMNTLKIVDKNNNPVGGVEIELLTFDGNGNVLSTESLGFTNSEGKIDYQLDCQNTCPLNVTLRIKGEKSTSKFIKLPVLGELLETSEPSFVYLSPGKDSSSMNVTWYTNTIADEFDVIYGKDIMDLTAETTSEIVPFYFKPKTGLVKIHKAKLNNLVSNSEYSYMIKNSDNQSQTFKFKTARNDNTVKLHIIGDTQTLDNDNPIGGSPMIGSLLDKMDIELPNKDMIIHVGDFTDDITLYSLVERFLVQITGQDKASSVPLVVAQGNHEVYNEGYYKFGQMFNFDNNNNLKEPINKAVYSLDYNNIHIAVISSEIFDDNSWSEMIEWLKEDMESSDKQWKIILTHRPPYEANPASGNAFLNKNIPPIADELGIDLVISGHDHIYSRSKPIKSNQIDESGTTYLIAGSASAKFYDAGTGGIVPFIDVIYDENIHTYTTIEIIENQMKIVTKNINDVEIDTHTIFK